MSASICTDYIRSAIARHGDRGCFLVGTATDYVNQPDQRMANSDLVICNGLLHHLEDQEVLDVLRLAQEVLKPGGRLICFEPTYLIY